ncbi:uncharacterized protein LOC100175336 isoform X1 [Ciona intestinalis]
MTTIEKGSTADIALNCLAKIRKWFEVNERLTFDDEDLAENEQDRGILWFDVLYSELCKGVKLSKQQSNRAIYICEWFVNKSGRKNWAVLTGLSINLLSLLKEGTINLLTMPTVTEELTRVLNNQGTIRGNLNVAPLHIITSLSRLSNNKENATAIANSTLYICLQNLAKDTTGKDEISEAAEVLLSILPQPQYATVLETKLSKRNSFPNLD